MPLNIAILASGSGTNAQAMIDKAAQGVLDVNIALIVCNRPGAGVVSRAEKAGIPCLVLDHKSFPDRESFDARMVEALREAGAEGLVGNRGQVFDVVLEVGDVQVVQALGVQHLQADRHLLQVLGAFLRGHRDFVERDGLLLGLRRGFLGERGGAERQVDRGRQRRARQRTRRPRAPPLACLLAHFLPLGLHCWCGCCVVVLRQRKCGTSG